MAFDTIHETSISDIADIIKNGISAVKSTVSRSSSIAHSTSLTKATKGLILEFPVLVSKANHIESAGIVAKAYEAKFVTLLQLAFSASNITNSKDALDYIKTFHTNLDDSKFTVDDFIGVMDTIVQHNSTNMSADDYAKYRAVTEDMKNLCYYFGDDINESSLNSYKVMNNYGTIKVVKEAQSKGNRNPNRPNSGDDIDQRIRDMQNSEKLANDITRTANDTTRTGNDTTRTGNDITRTSNDTRKTDSQVKRNDIQNDLDQKDYDLKVQRSEREKDKEERDKATFAMNMLPTNILSSDIRKANELTPTMLVVNFVITPDANVEAIHQSVIIGVKAKLYEVDPVDVITKIITKHVDSNILLKLIKVSTREVSFVKDFLLAIDDAKLDALSKSRKGSSNKLFKTLERRALGGKIRRGLKMKDYTKAISSLVISQEEVEELLKNNIDVNNPKVIRPIMEKLNLISFAIIDESSESVRFIFDTGDDVYETIPLSKLEREQNDGMSKKVINLLAKMNR